MEEQRTFVCIDSDVLVDFLRGVDYAVSWVEEAKESYVLATTVINVFELYAGAYSAKDSPKKKESVDSLVSYLKILPLSLKDVEDAGKEYSTLKKKGGFIGNEDILVGVVAKNNDCFLKTNNKKHFSRISGLSLID